MRATFVRSLSGFQGNVRLYRLDALCGHPSYVVVSALDVPYSGPRTCIYSATSKGDVLSWEELTGSYRGGLDHAEALRRAGYEVQEESTVNVNACQNEVNDG